MALIGEGGRIISDQQPTEKREELPAQINPPSPPLAPSPPLTPTVTPIVQTPTVQSAGEQLNKQEIQEGLAILSELLAQEEGEEALQGVHTTANPKVLTREEQQVAAGTKAVVSDQPPPKLQQAGQPQGSRNGLTKFLIGRHRDRKKSLA
jgi:hypothetical protein